MGLRSLLLPALALGAGCVLEAKSDGEICEVGSCAVGEVCLEGMCVPRADDPVDAAIPDAALADAAPPVDGRPLETLELRVAAGTDDAEERADNSMYLDSSDLELTESDGAQVIGIRFVDVAIPPGASVSAAFIQFEVDEATSVETSLVLHAEAADDAATFGALLGDISARPTTSASVEWAPAPWPTLDEAGAEQRTPDLAALVQEVVDRPDWSSGNALAVIISGTGERVAEAFEGEPEAAPLLRVEFIPGG